MVILIGAQSAAASESLSSSSVRHPSSPEELTESNWESECGETWAAPRRSSPAELRLVPEDNYCSSSSQKISANYNYSAVASPHHRPPRSWSWSPDCSMAPQNNAAITPLSSDSLIGVNCNALGKRRRQRSRRKGEEEEKEEDNNYYGGCSPPPLKKWGALLVIFVIVLVNCSSSSAVSASTSVEDTSSLESSNSLNDADGFPPELSREGAGRAQHIYSNHFAVHVPAGDQRATEIAQKHGFVNTGQIGSLKNYYLFEHARIRKRSVDQSHDHHKLLSDEPDVHWFEQQVEKRRVKRDFQYYDGTGHGGPSAGSGSFYGSPSTHSYASPYQTGHGGFPDPLWKEQWYLTGGSKDGFDMNVQVAWKRGYTGKGVTVSILDDGIQTNHPDLILNYDPRASTDINDNDNDPYPQDNGDNKHGTRCAGEVAATAGNNICGVGVAYNASIGGVRMLDGTVNDAVEAKALGLNPDHVDIFSASWGPEDDGKTVDGPGPLARRAFIYGVTNGRRGLGSIFIWASGNGGRHVDSCNCDGYTNSIFTLSISSATQGGYKPWYLEECSSTLATTYSSGTPTLDKSVATVDMDGRLRPDHICTVEHTGTSASAPLAAGIAALALEANPNLSWRDLQHLVVLTSRPDPLEKEEGWYVNGVQRKFSHKFGYGLMDAGKMVDLAVDWAGVPPQHICKSREIREDREVPGSHLGKVKVFMDVDGCAGTNSEIRYLEHVQCKISLRFFPRGNLRILLTSPMGTTSVLLFERPRDVSSSNFDDWPFLSVHYWGEQAHGRWTLEIINSGSRRINQPGMLKKWQLILYGSDVNPVRLKSRSLNLGGHHPTGLGQGTASSISHGQYSDVTGEGPSSHPSYRAVNQQQDGTSLPPRFVPQEYLFSSASENRATHVVLNEQKKGHQTRSQCGSGGNWWVKDLAICVNDCPEGYFEDGGQKECLSCAERCKSCYNATSCTACEHNLVLFKDKCVARCPGGWWEADSSCERCPVEKCKSCAGVTGQECVECEEGMWLEDGKCVGECPRGKRKSGRTGECVDCSVGCGVCGEGEGCLECLEGFSRVEGGKCRAKEDDCPQGMWREGEAGECKGCGEEGCLRCGGAEGQQCLECRQGLRMKRGRCVGECGTGWWESWGECFKCAGMCVRCSGEGQCEECRADGLLQEGRCLPHCQQGYFNDRGVCVGCSSACETCIGPKDNECVSCEEGRRLTKSGTCAPLGNPGRGGGAQGGQWSNGTCEDGWFLDGGTNMCRECHPSCSRCTGAMAFHCRACRYPLRLDRGSSRCIPCCKNENGEDCCHCDEKRHSTPSTYNGECHFVSRRVSESTEREISGEGGLSDKVVFMSFWFTVFVLVLAVIVVLQRSKKGKRLRGGDLSNSLNYFNSSNLSGGRGDDENALLSNGKEGRGSWRKGNGVKYTPVNMTEEDEDEEVNYYNRSSGSNHNQRSKDSKLRSKPEVEDDEETEEEFEHILSLQQQHSEGVPLVLKT